jgi:pyruvate/2-oxoacid:ferredoxin oxidoreductase alpha subunit/NAD-dependent dihydropyrimidine dehydrogenase PreA subunit
MSQATQPSTARGVPRPKPFLLPELCKGCGRCIGACPKHCIAFDDSVDPRTGLVPVVLDLDACNGCGLCLTACPEPYGLRVPEPGAEPGARFPLPETAEELPAPQRIPDEYLPLPERQPMALKGTHAAAVGALLAGCRHFYGYPITPSTEGSELMARLLPKLGGFFVQAVSEVATVNHLYGCGGAGQRGMTFTSSPGFSLMLEGISYMIGAEVPAVIVDAMRGGPGLGNIAPEQTDIKLACRGLGHGHTHAVVLAASSPQEMLDLTMLAFELAFRYRNPVVLLADGYLGQMTGKVSLPPYFVKPGLPTWAVSGDREHRRNLICSIFLAEADLEAHNIHLLEKYAAMEANEQRSECWRTDDAEVLLVACNTPARTAKGAVEKLREQGVAAGLFRPVTLWPFPIQSLTPVLAHTRKIVVVESSPGQLEDELRLAMSHAGVGRGIPIDSVQRYGGVVPSIDEIVRRVLAAHAHHGFDGSDHGNHPLGDQGDRS